MRRWWGVPRLTKNITNSHNWQLYVDNTLVYILLILCQLLRCGPFSRDSALQCCDVTASGHITVTLSRTSARGTCHVSRPQLSRNHLSHLICIAQGAFLQASHNSWYNPVASWLFIHCRSYDLALDIKPRCELSVVLFKYFLAVSYTYV